MAFVFVDTETTGLDHQQDQLLEVACVATDDDLNVRSSITLTIKPSLLPAPGSTPFEMHTTNGLLEECQKYGVGLKETDDRISKWLRSLIGIGAQQGQVPMCGSTIGFDRQFVERDLPKMAAWFHYRSVDVSSVKLLWKAWWGDLGVPPEPEIKPHRAYEDVLCSIAELRWYRDHLSPSVAGR